MRRLFILPLFAMMALVSCTDPDIAPVLHGSPNAADARSSAPGTAVPAPKLLRLTTALPPDVWTPMFPGNTDTMNGVVPLYIENKRYRSAEINGLLYESTASSEGWLPKQWRGYKERIGNNSIVISVTPLRLEGAERTWYGVTWRNDQRLCVDLIGNVPTILPNGKSGHILVNGSASLDDIDVLEDAFRTALRSIKIE